MDESDRSVTTLERSVDDRLAVGFSRIITRRTFFSRAARGILALGTVATTSLWFADTALAWTCSPGGSVGNWGNFCAGTTSCPSCHPDNSCAGRTRCTFWGTSPYCEVVP